MQKEYVDVTLQVRLVPGRMPSARDEVYKDRLAQVTPEDVAKELAEYLDGMDLEVLPEDRGDVVEFVVLKAVTFSAEEASA